MARLADATASTSVGLETHTKFTVARISETHDAVQRDFDQRRQNMIDTFTQTTTETAELLATNAEAAAARVAEAHHALQREQHDLGLDLVERLETMREVKALRKLMERNEGKSGKGEETDH